MVFFLCLRIACAYENPTFTLNIATPHVNLKIGEPAVIHVTLKSNSKNPVKLVEAVNSGQTELNYIVDARNEAGKVVPYTAYGRDVVQNRIIVVSRRLDTINEGQQIEEDMFLDKFVNLAVPGTYTVRLARKDPLNPTSLAVEPLLVSVLVT